MLPDKMLVELPYYDLAFTSLNNSGTAPAITANSTFAPVAGGYVSATQPLERDQWAAMYTRYIVHAFTFASVSCVENTTGSSGICDVAVAVTPGVPAATTTKGVAEQSRRHYKTGVIAAGSGPFVVSGKVDMADLFGRSKEEYRSNDSLYGAAVGASPTAVAQFTCAIQERATVGTSVLTTIFVKYLVEFYDRTPVAGS